MKRLALLIVFVAFVNVAGAQIIFRNDFIIGKNSLKNKGLTSIAINLDRYPNPNMLIYGRGGKSLVIDVDAIRHPGKVYTYSEIAEKIYTPGPTFRPSVEAVPAFLIREPDPSLRQIRWRSKIFSESPSAPLGL